MTTTIALAVLAVVSLVIAAVSYMYGNGIKAGIKHERARCESLVRQSWECGGKLSPTARRIYVSVCNGRTKLISENEFWN